MKLEVITSLQDIKPGNSTWDKHTMVSSCCFRCKISSSLLFNALLGLWRERFV
jgi:hypothetical protein